MLWRLVNNNAQKGKCMENAQYKYMVNNSSLKNYSLLNYGKKKKNNNKIQVL